MFNLLSCQGGINRNIYYPSGCHRKINYYPFNPVFRNDSKFVPLAGRFAAKEAISKAISTGWSGIFKWKDVEILNDEYGKPEVILYNQLKAQFESCSFHISISHSLNYA
ncbi:holo-ACP synthase, partial [Candidatus Kryptonium thompsonii]|uniref:holo-ACP synthase n=1 Tax=Candidatus Kryptonium thompsonii TaxID=1633631 RepID=UPI0011477515